MEHDFSSIDRMMELGMGMAMGQQVAKSMNDMMDSLRRPPELQITAQPLHAQQAIAPGATPQPAYRPYLGENATPQTAQAVAQDAPADVYYVSLESGKQSGPYSGIELARLVMERKVTEATLVWKSGMEAWKAASELEEVASLIKLVPQASSQTMPQVQD